MLHNLPPLPPIKGEKGDEPKFPRASSASKYMQVTHDEGKLYFSKLLFFSYFKTYILYFKISKKRYLTPRV